jgi:hypothetical protein
MVNNTFEQELIDAVRRLTEREQQDVLRYAWSKAGRPMGTPGKVFLDRLEDIHIPAEDLEEMKRVIEEDCAHIDWGEWDLDAGRPRIEPTDEGLEESEG